MTSETGRTYAFSSDQTHILKGKVRSHRLAKAKERKIERLVEKYPDVDIHNVTEWVNDDFDNLQSRLDESRRFFEQLKVHGNIPIKSTGKKWYHFEQRVGRVFKSIHESNISNDTTTMLIFRSGDSTVYRLTVKSGQEMDVLPSAISKGYIISEMIINYGDIK